MPISLLEDLTALLAVQAVDTQIDRARAALAALDTGASTAAAYNTSKAAADAWQTVAIKAQAGLRDAELRLASLETKASDVNKSLYGGKVTATRELENLQRELDMLGRQKSEAEDAVLAAMEASGEETTRAQFAAEEATALADKYRVIRVAYKKAHGVLTVEIAKHEAEREKAVVPVSPGLLQKYEAIRGKRNGVGVSALQPDGTCGACHTQLSTGLVEGVRDAQTAQTCEHCGRLLSPAPVPAGEA